MEPQPEPTVVTERQTEAPARPQAGLAPPQPELSPTGTHVFDANGISIYYSAFRAVTDVSFSIYENEITAFIGPSGCGKTTVLRSLNRMNDLIAGARVEGDVRYRDAPLYGSGVSPIAVRRRIGSTRISFRSTRTETTRARESRREATSSSSSRTT